MTTLDSVVQILLTAFVGLIVMWTLSSFAEMRISLYLYQALAFVSRLISSEVTFDPKFLPEIVVTEGFFRGRKAVARLNVLSPRYLSYRIHVHLLVQPRLSDRGHFDDFLAHRNPSRTVVWLCSLITPPFYGELTNVFKELTAEAEALEIENAR